MNLHWTSIYCGYWLSLPLSPSWSFWRYEKSTFTVHKVAAFLLLTERTAYKESQRTQSNSRGKGDRLVVFLLHEDAMDVFVERINWAMTNGLHPPRGFEFNETELTIFSTLRCWMLARSSLRRGALISFLSGVEIYLTPADDLAWSGSTTVMKVVARQEVGEI